MGFVSIIEEQAELPDIEAVTLAVTMVASHEEHGGNSERHDGSSCVDPRFLDLRTAARYVGVSYWTLRDMVLSGIIPSVKLPCPHTGDGRTIWRVLIDRHDLAALIERWKERIAP